MCWHVECEHVNWYGKFAQKLDASLQSSPSRGVALYLIMHTCTTFSFILPIILKTLWKFASLCHFASRLIFTFWSRKIAIPSKRSQTENSSSRRGSEKNFQFVSLNFRKWNYEWQHKATNEKDTNDCEVRWMNHFHLLIKPQVITNDKRIILSNFVNLSLSLYLKTQNVFTIFLLFFVEISARI